MLKELINIAFICLALFLIGKTFSNLLVSWYKNYRRPKKTLQGKRLGMHSIEIIRVFAFAKLFAVSLNIVFLSRFMMEITIASGMPQSFGGVVYALYQIAFIMMLIPSGYLVEIKNLKLLLIIATCIEGATFVGYAFTNNVWELLVLQVVIGLTVPLATAVVYAYIFKLSGRSNRGQAIASYSNTLRGAAIAGTFAGGLLLSHLSMRTIFLIGGAVNFLAALYALVLVPNIKARYFVTKMRNIPAARINFKTVLKSLPNMLKSIDFLKTVLLVGLPLGILEEGIILFSMPIILPHYGVKPETIGKLLVLFSIGFFITNKYISKLADKKKLESLCMVVGLFGWAVSLCLIAGMHLGIIVITFGLLLLGIFRGFIFSPAMSYVSKHPVTVRVGKNVPIAVYSFFETAGRIIGPILMIQLLVIFNYSDKAFLVIGGICAVCGLLFLALKNDSKNKS